MALKTYRASHQEDFEDEKTALVGLHREEENRPFVRYLGHFMQEKKINGNFEWTYNLLLEYGEQDLDEYFATVPPPATSDDIIAFWRNLFKIGDALKFVHRVSQTSEISYYG